MHLFFSVGEPSGDQHAAALMCQLRTKHAGVRFSGFGGPQMQSSGLQCLYPLTDLAVMGIGQVLPLLKQFRDLVRDAERFLQHERPDALVLVDFPGFNWWIARAAKRVGIPVYYYCPPQLWAWAPWRIRKVRRLIDCVLSVLPFEAEWYRQRGVDVEYVGHPFFDEVAAHPLSAKDVAELRSEEYRTIGVLPGSRKQEVYKNFPVMLDTMQRLYERHPKIRFEVACYKQWHFETCSGMTRKSDCQLPVTFHVGKTSEIIEAADFCLMVSGSVSLEVLARKTPAVVIYRGSPLLYVLGHLLINVDYFTLPNLIADAPLMPEFPLVRRHSPAVDKMVSQLDSWLTSPVLLEESRTAVASLADSIVSAGGIARAADVLIQRVQQQQALRPVDRRAA